MSTNTTMRDFELAPVKFSRLTRRGVLLGLSGSQLVVVGFEHDHPVELLAYVLQRLVQRHHLVGLVVGEPGVHAGERHPPGAGAALVPQPAAGVIPTQPTMTAVAAPMAVEEEQAEPGLGVVDPPVEGHRQRLVPGQDDRLDLLVGLVLGLGPLAGVGAAVALVGPLVVAGGCVSAAPTGPPGTVPQPGRTSAGRSPMAPSRIRLPGSTGMPK